MARASVWILCISVVTSSAYVPRYNDVFHYKQLPKNYFRRSGDVGCSICYSGDCISMEQARCQYYTAVSELMNEVSNKETAPEDPMSEVLRSNVDSLLMSLVDEASVPPLFKQCIPFISSYTGCTKENTCLGCTSCDCDIEGRWNCSLVQQCTPESEPDVDHRTLVLVMDALRKGDTYEDFPPNDENMSFRDKRSVKTEEPEDKGLKLTYEDLSEWMYGVRTLPSNYRTTTKNNAEAIKATEATTQPTPTNEDNLQSIITIEPSTPPYNERTKTESDYLAFDDVLNNIEVEGKIYSRRKTLDVHKDAIKEHDYTIAEDNSTTYTATDNMLSENFYNAMNVVEEENDEGLIKSTPGTTEVVIDLLEHVRKKIRTEALTKPNATDFDIFANSNDVIDYNIINLRKRDVSDVNKNNSFVNVTGSLKTVNESNSDAKPKIGLSSDVFGILNKVILTKQKELNDLVYLKKKIIELSNTTRNVSFDIHMSNTSLVNEITNNSLSFFNIEFLKHPFQNFRRSNPQDVGKHLEKLRLDILVVMKDILELRSLIGRNKFSTDLKNLIRAMKHYVRNTGRIPMTSNKTLIQSYRRSWQQTYPLDNNVVKRHLIDIFKIIDKNMPESNALSPLSPKSKQIIMRVINSNRYLKDSIDEVKVIDPESDFSKLLTDIGIKGLEISAAMSDIAPCKKLHYLKLLHTVILSDIKRLTEALPLTDFMSTRRSAPMMDSLNEQELDRINLDLKAIQTKIKRILEFRGGNIKGEPAKNVMKLYTTTGSSKKETLLKHIRNLLRNSKKDILRLLRKRVPKSEIVKELARKKLDQLTSNKLIEYDSIMQKWQKDMNVLARKKRSINLLGNIKSRIKNILPKYLRGKVHTGMKNSTKGRKKHSKTTQRPKQHSHTQGPFKATTTIMKIMTTPVNRPSQS